MRLLIVCFVALTLPLQGLAAAFMTHCAPGHAHATSTATHDSAHHADHHGDATNTAGHQATDHHQFDQAKASLHADEHSSSADRDGCSALCCAAMITQSAHVIETDSGRLPLARSLARATVDRYLRSIERPPRVAHA
jgi:hypothetical protein